MLPYVTRTTFVAPHVPALRPTPAFPNATQASGFAGPTILPHLPQLFPCAAHMSDISFFWGAPAWWRVTVPWAVTANMVLKNSAACHRFGLQFPKTGGGEDIDMCLRAAPEGLLSVPAAMVVHPWWGGGSQHLFLRFALWSWGDSLLTDHFPSVGYRVCPSATELCACLLLLQLLVLLAAAASTTASLCRLPLPLVPAEIAALKMIVAIKLTDIILDVARNILLPQRRHRVVADGCPWWLLLPAAAESCIIKTFSEAGRLLRHISRGRLLNIGVRFDWFCGSDPDIPPREQAKAAVRLGLYLMAAVLACADVGTIKIACSQLGLPISAAAAAFTTALVSLLRMFCEVEGK